MPLLKFLNLNPLTSHWSSILHSLLSTVWVTASNTSTYLSLACKVPTATQSRQHSLLTSCHPCSTIYSLLQIADCSSAHARTTLSLESSVSFLSWLTQITVLPIYYILHRHSLFHPMRLKFINSTNSPPQILISHNTYFKNKDSHWTFTTNRFLFRGFSTDCCACYVVE